MMSHAVDQAIPQSPQEAFAKPEKRKTQQRAARKGVVAGLRAAHPAP